MYDDLVKRLRHDSESRALMLEAADAIEELSRQRDRAYARRPSNADRIRSKSDEELAEFFGTLPCCPPGKDLEELCFPLDSCEGTDFNVKCWLKWLRQEA